MRRIFRKPASACALLFLFSCATEAPQQAPANAPAPTATTATNGSLRQEIATLLQGKKATVGVAVKHLGTGDTFSYNGAEKFPLMSVAKFPEALMLLSRVDRGTMRLEEPIHYAGSDLKVRTMSSFRKDHPGDPVQVSLLESLRYAMGQSDNITSNKFFQLLGGPKAVEAYMHEQGIAGMGLSTDYAHMQADSPLQNWGTPWALVQLLEKFDQKKMLSDSSSAVLFRLMAESVSGADRLKAGLPAGTVIAHKTGTSGRNAAGVMAACNDVGIVEGADGGRYAIAVFVGNSGESDSVNASIIRDISRLVWERYSRQ